ncbi:MAG: hypothetical protein ACN6PR_05075 [Achromobacter sp.]
MKNLNAGIGVSKLVAAYRADIQRPGKRYSTISKFRASIPEEHYFSAYKSLFFLKNSLQDYHGAAFPRSPTQLFSNATPKQPVNAYRELLWAIARCFSFSEQLSSFVEAKNAFENHILMGRYEDALASLKFVEERFGKSVWLYQNMLAASFTSSADSDSVEMSKNILEEVKDNGVLVALLHYIQRRIEGATLRDQLRAELYSNIESDVLRNHFLAKVLDGVYSDDTVVSNLLFLDAQSSLIDHYSSLIQALQAAVSDQKINTDADSCIVSALVKLYKATRDRRILGILAGLGYPHPDSISENPLRQKSIEAYTDGNYKDAVRLSELVLQQTPLDSAMRLLNVKASVALGEVPIHIGGVVGEINANLFNILSANDGFFGSAHALLMMADRFFDHNWMQFIRVAVYYEIGSEQNKIYQTWMRDQCVRDIYLSPWIALTLRQDRAQPLVDFLQSAGCYPATLALVTRVSTIRDEDVEGLNPREARYMAREALANKDYIKASRLYAHGAQGEHRRAVKLRALGGAALAESLNHQFERAVETLIDAYIECPNAPTILPVGEIVDKMPDIDRWPNVISLAMLFNLALQMGDGGDLSKTRLAFEKFCEENNILSPKDLGTRIEEFGAFHVISFLDTVWRPEVMRQTLLYRNASQIEEARIEACQVLARIDPDRSRIYQQELASRVKQQEIAKTSALVEQSKVYVDIEAIKRSLRLKLKGSYGQYKNSLGQHGKPRDDVIETLKRVFADRGESISLSTLLSQFHALSLPDSGTQTDVQFNALFTEITKEFLTGDHGLNAYLSTRVRHGKFVDALRKSVTDQQLVTSRFEDGSYAPNSHWNEGLSETTKEKLIGTLEGFSRQFDEILFDMRDKRIQIRTLMGLQSSDGNNKGLFVYQFSNLERKLMQSYDADFKDLDELISKCVDILWEKTDANLEGVRSYLAGTLSMQINSAFEDFNREISNACSGNIPPGMANAIARAGTATQQALENVVAWFRRSEVYDRQDFEIDLPAQIAASMVRRIMAMQNYWNGPNSNAQATDVKLPGRLLDDLVDIYYALFENAVQYAEQECVPLKINIDHQYKSGELRAVVTSSALPPTEAQLARLAALKESLSSEESRRLAQSEGRSGFRKIILALSRPIYKSSELNFEHRDSGEFRVSFSFKISDYQ